MGHSNEQSLHSAVARGSIDVHSSFLQVFQNCSVFEGIVLKALIIFSLLMFTIPIILTGLKQ